MRTLKLLGLLVWMLCASVFDSQAQCNAAFSFSTKICEGGTVQFYPSDSSGSKNYAWNFGDLISGNANDDSTKSPLHYFAKDGVYTISLIVYDSTCSDTVTQNLTVYKNPVANFNWDNNCQNLITAFSGSATTDPADSVLNWNWLLDAGVNASGNNPTHIYSSTGTKNVRLVITTAAGCTDTINKNVVVHKKPTGTMSANGICLNSQVDFTADTISTATDYTWNFGDSSFFTKREVSHIYKKTGWMHPKLTVSFSGKTCTVLMDSLEVYNPPDASFYIPKDTQCFNNNLVCIVLKNTNQNITFRSVIFDDGYLDDNSPLSDSVICHSYADAGGGTYSITVELTDGNNCFSTETQTDAVVILPQVKADFTFIAGPGCFTTPILITNTSNKTPPLVSKFYWNFGDGSGDSTTWTNLSHQYTTDGQFNITLTIEDTFGCPNQKTSNQPVTNTNFVVDASVDTVGGYCRNNNYFIFKQTPIPGATISWQVIPTVDTTVNLNQFTVGYRYGLPGTYFPRVVISKNGCDSIRYLDSIVIHGPVARIGGIVNQFQCQSRDTVYFTNNSTLYRNKSAISFWDAGDTSAAGCTIHTPTGSNVGLNCRYSSDSFSFKHFYPKNVENCYYVKLVIRDTAIGCYDSVSVPIPIMRPQAKGLFLPSNTTPCPGMEPGKAVSFNQFLPKPTCLKYRWWVMWDSLKAAESGNFNAAWQLNSSIHYYNYNNYPGDSLGYVTTGLIMENGLDTNGVVCRDTGWFHNIMKVTQVSPIFYSSYTPSNYYCPGSTLHFFLKDSNQPSGVTFRWSFGDGTTVTTTNQNYQSHQFKKSGTYYVQLSVQHPNGCRVDSAMLVHIGFRGEVYISDKQICAGENTNFLENIEYNPVQGNWLRFWSNPARTAAGKELVLYDIGDGNGFQNIGANPAVNFPYPGIYKISMLSRDSVGCWDTAWFVDTVHVSGIYANFSMPSDSLLCAQTVKFTSLSSVIDATVSRQYPGDFIKVYEWNFGSQYPKSFVPNPLRFFATGNYNVQLKVTNNFGCSDSIVRSLVVQGPKAQYQILSDTIGCSPLLVTFKNSSDNSTSYIWQFGDSFNSNFGTLSDTNVSFSYKGHGQYYPSLVARGSFTKNGVTQICDDIFPDTSSLIKQSVVVWELPKPDFTWVTDCSSGTTKFSAKNKILTGSIVSVSWNFGDGSSSADTAPVHAYPDTGVYRVVLIATSEHGCMDSVAYDVVISPTPVANFGYNFNCFNTLTRFEDSSLAFNDRIYLWNWDLGDGTVSNLKNPTRLYTKDTTYQVRLIITNIAGCTDTAIKNITIFSKPSVSFSFQNSCAKSHVIFANNSSSKQAIFSQRWTHGDGSFSNTYQDTHSYASHGDFRVKLVLRTVHGCMDSTQDTITIHPLPIANLVIDKKTACEQYHSFSFGDSSTIPYGSITSQWNLSDGYNSTAKMFVHSFDTFGRYTARLVSISALGCTDTATDSVSVFAMPDARFSTNLQAQCLRGNAFIFSDSSSIATGSFTSKWEFGDGQSSTANPATHSYADTGLYQVLLIATSDQNCSDSSWQNTRVWPMPVANYTVNDSTQCLSNNAFIFTNSSSISAGSIAYLWSFGDQNTSNATNPNHSYLLDSSYTVSLIVTSDKNCADTLYTTSLVYPMPKAAFAINDSAECLRQNNFSFTNQTTIKSGSLSYNWNFGDSANATAQDPNHIYNRHGSFDVKLVATSAFGCVDSSKVNLVVHPMPVLKLLVNNPAQCINTQQFTFEDSSSIALGSLVRKWRFGDSTTSNLAYVVKTFAYPGTHVNWLVQFSDQGCGDSASQSIQVYPKPYPAFNINDEAQCLRGNAFVFTNNSTLSSGSMSFTWRFGDGNSAATQNAAYAYSNYDTFLVTLKPRSAFGCEDSIQKSVVVHPMPVADFLVNDSEQCLRQNQFDYTNSSSVPYGILSYQWFFGDNNNATNTDAQHIYGNTGNYSVTLAASTEHSCADTMVKDIWVRPMPQVDFIINDSDQCINNQAFVFTDLSSIEYGALTRLWKVSDNSSSASAVYNKTFGYDSTYDVHLVQTSNHGCMDSLAKKVIVFSKPNPRFTVDDAEQCLRQNYFTFTNTSTIKKGTLTHLWDFGDNNTAGTNDAGHKYAAHGTFKVLLTSTSENNCTDTISMAVFVSPMPVVSFSINDTGQCVNNQLFQFTNASSVAYGSLSPLWRLGDGSTSTAVDPTKVYTKDTNYTVWLIQTTDKGCQDSTKKMVDVYPKPFVAYTINDTIQCLRQNQFAFTNNSKIKYGTFNNTWTYGDGNTESALHGSHKYNVHGVFKTVLTAVSNLNCVDSSFVFITVGAMPRVAFSINDPGQCFKTQNFIFTNQSTIDSGNFNQTWHYGDGQTATTLDASHQYAAIGNFLPKLVLTSDLGCMDSLQKGLWVYPNAQPSFTVNDSDQCQNQQNYEFTNTSKVATGKIQSILWDLGNGKTATADVVKSYYPKSGTFRIQLATTTDSGCLDTFHNLIRVYPKPAAWFDINDSAQCLFQNNYTFTDVSQDSFGVNLYRWNIHNEDVQTTKTANYIFKTSGFKNITLISTSLRGCSDTIMRTVYVKPMPDPRFDKLESYYCELTGPHTFNPVTAGGTFYGKNIQNNLYNPVLLWADTVRYVVTVNGCTDSSEQYTNVYPGPKVNLGSDTTLCKFEMLQLEINSWQSTYLWDDGTKTPSRKIVEPGTYFVTVSNICGVKKDTIHVQYRPINCRFFLPNAFTPNGDGKNDRFKPWIQDVSEMTYIIYNRWGQQVYEGHVNDNGWDGSYLGAPVPNGTYIVHVRYKYDLNYRRVELIESGTVEVLR